MPLPKDWLFDLGTLTASHCSGFAVRFRPSTGAQLAIGTVVATDADGNYWTGRKVGNQDLKDASNGVLRIRLLTEAGEVFNHAMKAARDPFPAD